MSPLALDLQCQVSEKACLFYVHFAYIFNNINTFCFFFIFFVFFCVIYFNCVCIYMYVWVSVYACECRYIQRPEEGVASPRARGTLSCEPPDVVGGYWARAVHVLSHWAISSALKFHFYLNVLMLFNYFALTFQAQIERHWEGNHTVDQRCRVLF